MAHDKTIPHPKPGIASFQQESWGNTDEVLFGDTPPVATQSKTVTSSGAATFQLYSVVNIAENGAITMAAVTAGESNATHILAAPVVFSAGESMDVPVYVAGHFRQQGLVFGASYNTDALKQNAFHGSDTPMILISKALYNESDFPA